MNSQRKKEISRLFKKRVLFSGTRNNGSEWETIGTRKDRRHPHSYCSGNKHGRTKSYKKISNKVVRGTNNISSGNNYRKAFDYQRTIY